MATMWEKFIINDFMRKDIDKNSTREDLKNTLKDLSKELEKIINTDQTNEVLFDGIKKWPFETKEFSLNQIISEGRNYKVSKLIKIEKNEKQVYLTNGKDKVIIPDNYLDLTTYILSQEFITYNSINLHFKNLHENIIKDALEKLENMKVIY
jgi:hypothetical protein